MALYLYQAGYTPESLAAQMKNPADRLEIVAGQIKSAGVRMVTGGYSLGEYDVVAIMEAPDDATMAGVSLAIAAGGAVRDAKTTKLLSGAEYVSALKKASSVGYHSAK
jgi:uncharacterized protein with GYD domain